ncbi:hypothetical protein [Rhizobium sp. BK176]|uniref:hypothetical protein n=1 Tax=Rhizobium sp. BK176 TaxID=2587071 RepID=UPI0021699402|nr:hypothetical protein [Rhizobium sp. BK176]MCS4088585.1 hypothetical protein [Rhizobium sp. BK176]
MVTEYMGSVAEPTPEERELASRKRQLVDELREETSRIRESFGPIMKMHGDETIGFVAHDEFDTVERAAREYSDSKKKTEAALAESEKHHATIGGYIFLSLLAAIGLGVYLGLAMAFLTFIVAACCIMPFGFMKPWPDSVRAKLKDVNLVQSLAAQRPGFRLKGLKFLVGDQPLEIEWLAVGRSGVAFLDEDKRPSYVAFKDFLSVYADTQCRQVSMEIAVGRSADEIETVTIQHPQTSDIPTTRAYAEDTVADFIATAIADAKTGAA